MVTNSVNRQALVPTKAILLVFILRVGNVIHQIVSDEFPEFLPSVINCNVTSQYQ